MSLNAIINHMQTTEPEAIYASRGLNDKEKEYAERIFFEKQLKECNPGMSEDKIKGRIRKSIETARMLYAEIYGK